MTPPLTIPPATKGRRVWLRVGTMLDGVTAQPRRDAHLVYDAKGILYVGEGATPPRELLIPGQSAPDAHLPGVTVVPGLLEAHAHLFLEGGELDAAKRAAYLQQTPGALLAAAKTRLPKLARYGIAGIRDAGDKDGVGLALSKAYREGRAAAAAGVESPALSATPQRQPYLESPGAAIHHQGRYGSFMAEPLEQHASPRACVAARVAAGADRIKLIPTGIINFKQGAVTTEPQMTTQEVTALVAAAAEFQRQTFAHASGDRGIERVIDGGVDSVEHGFFIRDDQLARLRDRNIAWVPTFAPVQRQIDHAAIMGWDDTIVGNLRRILDSHAAALVKAHEMGVVVVAGSDAGSYGVAHGTGLLYELELMERAGMPAGAVIIAATGAGARRFKYREPLGQIAPGYRSRFILTRHSPLETVRNLGRERTIVFDDQVFATDERFDVANL